MFIGSHIFAVAAALAIAAGTGCAGTSQARPTDRVAPPPAETAAPGNLVALSMHELFMNEPVEGWAELAEDAAEAREVLPLARRLYNDRRPEFVHKFHEQDSRLVYPPAEKAEWMLYRKNAAITARTGCSDLMYAAGFYFTFEKDSAGRWQCTRIAGGEHFKGE